MIRIVSHIDVAALHTALQSDETGGIAFFTGCVRNHSKGRTVTKLVFEAYEPMALKEMEKIAARARERWPLQGLLIVHAIGEKLPGEPVVVTAAAATHRDAAFESCRFLIDELKKTVPIWKKEYYEDSSVWINAHP